MGRGLMLWKWTNRLFRINIFSSIEKNWRAKPRETRLDYGDISLDGLRGLEQVALGPLIVEGVAQQGQ
jgi:hypothetical protein